jgi:hypothetical protein
MRINKLRLAIASGLLLFGLSGCGGTKILKEPKALELQGSLAANADQRIGATFDWVIVRDGPGSWAKNADWDEYLIRVINSSTSPITINSVVVVDSLGATAESASERKLLVKKSRATSKRYKKDGLKVKAGLGGGMLILAGGVTAVTGMSAASAVVLGGGTAAAGAVAVVLAAPVIAIAGVVRIVNSKKVDAEISNRQTNLPLTLEAGDFKAMDVFFPLAPSPKELVVSYSADGNSHELVIDTGDVLDGLHLRARSKEDDSE